MLGNCSKLAELDVKANMIDGRIPPELGMLTKLEVFDASQNSFTDKMPNEVCNLDHLGSLEYVYADCEMVSCRCCQGCN